MTEVLLHSPIENINQTLPLFEEVYRRHYRDIAGYLYWRSGDYMLAEDLAQKVFLRLFERYTNVKGEITIIREKAKTASFLIRVASRILIDHRRTKRNDSMEDIEGFEMPERVSTDPAKLAIIKEGVEERATMTRVLQIGMEGLRPNYRNVLKASYIAGQSDTEIAAEFGVAHGTIKSRKHRAREALVRNVFPGGIATRNMPDSLREVGDYPF